MWMLICASAGRRIIPLCRTVLFPVCYGEKGIFTATLLTPPLSGRFSEFSGGTVRNFCPRKSPCKDGRDVV